MCEVELNRFGYYSLKIKPTNEALSNYYSTKYYQELQGSYEDNYSDEDVIYIHNKQSFLYKCLMKINSEYNYGRKFLDIGCGEGWTLKYFKEKGFSVKGVDFSDFGIKKLNSNLLKYFIKDDIDNFLKTEISKKNNYDVINLTNVIEHVLDPEKLLSDLKLLLSVEGVIIVTFPNDFSKMQELLLKGESVNNEFWISNPDHISYFTKDSFSNLAVSLEYKIESILADFPIDLFLLNKHSNYMKDKAKGKEAHHSRTRIINLLSEIDLELCVEAFLNFGSMGFGRNLTVFLKKN
jgi:2-polyprenyl-3-methyl-5-hydroxy-6-metoxy-1,4-benzoquinol methylase